MGMSGNFLSYFKGVPDPSVAQDGRQLFLESPQCNRASSDVERRISWFLWSCSSKLFLSSCDRDLRDSLVGPQESLVSMRVAKRFSGYL